MRWLENHKVMTRPTAESQASSYPRDLIGYGQTPPHAQWPDRAKIAVQFVINYEEGARTAFCTVTRLRRHFCRR